MWSFTVAVRFIRRDIADELRRAEDHVTKDCNLLRQSAELRVVSGNVVRH